MFEGRLVTFIRIPKNASTSIYNHVAPINTIKDEYMQSLKHSKDHMGIFAPSHCKLSDAVKVLTDEILKKFCFAVCRNPYDRMLSQYKFSQKAEFIPVDFKDFWEFIDFCVEEETIASHSQSYYLDVDTKIDVLRFENLQKDFSLFLRKNRILINPILPVQNKTPHKHYTEYYTPTLKEKVKAFWKEDFKRFNYDI